jgi:ATP-binding cassette, subfamily C, bacterial CydC
MSSVVTPDAHGPRSAVAFGGLVLAVLAEASSIGLLGLSGWFITASAIAGAAAYSSFSYVAPSGGVRAFALARIGGNYSQRLVLHSAALQRVADTRRRFFTVAAAASQSQRAGVWSGELLDRSMSDADAVGMALIQSTAPVTVAVVMALGGVLAVSLAISLTAATALTAGIAVVAAIALRTPGAAHSVEEVTRKNLRAEVVMAVDAWAEMASLGAAAQLATRTTTRLAQLHTARRSIARRTTRVAALTELSCIATLSAVLACALDSSIGAPPLVFAALVTVGALTNATRLPQALEARRTAASALARLTVMTPARTADEQLDVVMRSWVTDHDLGFDSYRLPATGLRAEPVHSARWARDGILAVTGHSGSGKSTLLRALAFSLRHEIQPADGRPAVTSVAADDYLFTGTLASNFRLADPEISDGDINERLAQLWLDRSGLAADTPVGHGGRDLSGGELRRVYLARALATRPHVLVVDEPTTGLDERTACHVLNTLGRLTDTSVVMALHEPPAYFEPTGSVSMLSLDWTSEPIATTANRTA